MRRAPAALVAPTQALDGKVTILARSKQALSRFDLDFAGQSVGSISVDQPPAAFRLAGRDLVITPGRTIPDGTLFSVTVSHFVAVPNAPRRRPTTSSRWPRRSPAVI